MGHRRARPRVRGALVQPRAHSPSLAQNSVSSLFRNNTLETVFRPFPTRGPSEFSSKFPTWVGPQPLRRPPNWECTTQGMTCNSWGGSFWTSKATNDKGACPSSRKTRAWELGERERDIYICVCVCLMPYIAFRPIWCQLFGSLLASFPVSVLLRPLQSPFFGFPSLLVFLL